MARGPTILWTILGSCVGVTLWSPPLEAGALCHGVLPRCPAGWVPTSHPSEVYRYVDASIRYLARQFLSIGAFREEVVVKVFGGADVLPDSGIHSERPTVGAQNCRVALEVLEDMGFRVAASDIGGICGRRIHFNTATGEVLLRRLGAWNSHS